MESANSGLALSVILSALSIDLVAVPCKRLDGIPKYNKVSQRRALTRSLEPPEQCRSVGVHMSHRLHDQVDFIMIILQVDDFASSKIRDYTRPAS